MSQPLSAGKKCLFAAMIFALLLLGLAALELVARALFPQMAGHVVSPTQTRNKAFHTERYAGAELRVPHPGYDLEAHAERRALLVIGDSISFGFGLAYPDIYWQRWQRVLDLRADEPVQIVSPAYMGNNFANNAEAIRKFVELFSARGIAAIVYQFNFNDVLPLRAEAVRAAVHLTPLQQALMEFRLRYLNRSVAQKVAAHYLNRLRHRLRSNDCAKLGADALGEYTYAYGAKGFEAVSSELWNRFDAKISEIRRAAPLTPFFILVSPLSPHVDPEYRGNYSTFRPHFECATIDPHAELRRIAAANEIALIDPTDYMAAIFRESLAEGNPAQMYFFNDLNHLNELGSSYFAEYSLEKLSAGLASARSSSKKND